MRTDQLSSDILSEIIEIVKEMDNEVLLSEKRLLKAEVTTIQEQLQQKNIELAENGEFERPWSDIALLRRQLKQRKKRLTEIKEIFRANQECTQRTVSGL